MTLSPERGLDGQGLNLSFHHLSYTRPAKGGKMKEVLHDISGQIMSGRLTAILGPSGAGKTSLLNVLAGYKTTGIQGQVMVNGKKRHLTEFRRQSCYIPQTESMLPLLTAGETLIIAAKMKLANYTDKIGRCVVSDILDLLHLTRCQHTRVGHMSGGERKRLSIGLELITNPPIMFFDEPTSGLDSVSSAQVIRHLRMLARSGHAVACVIHQPSSQLCHLFDDVMLLAQGRILYSGSIKDMVPVFEEAGFNYPTDYNRADFALEVASGERGEDLSKLMARYSSKNIDFVEDTRPTEETKMLPQDCSSVICIDPKQKLDFEHSNNNDLEYHSDSNVSQYAVSQFRQFQVLLGRCLLISTREMYMTYLRILAHIATGILLGFVCYDTGGDAFKVVTNSATLLFVVIFLYYINALPTAMVFPKERRVLLRELHNNWYSLPAYFFSKCLVNLPLQLLCPCLFLIPTYLMTGQPMDPDRIMLAICVGVLVSIFAQTMGMVLGAAFNGELGAFLIPVTSIPMLLFCGFFARLPDVPYVLKWLGSISYFKLAFEAMLNIVYGLDRPPLTCSIEFCFFKHPPKFMNSLGLETDQLANDIIGLAIWVLALNTFLFVALKIRVFLSRR